jgi:hypothetical protein
MAGGAQLLFEGVAVVGEGVQGSESNEGVPNVSAPEPGVGGGGDCPRDDGAQAAEFRVEYCEGGGRDRKWGMGPIRGSVTSQSHICRLGRAQVGRAMSGQSGRLEAVHASRAVRKGRQG